MEEILSLLLLVILLLFGLRLGGAMVGIRISPFRLALSLLRFGLKLRGKRPPRRRARLAPREREYGG